MIRQVVRFRLLWLSDLYQCPEMLLSRKQKKRPTKAVSRVFTFKSNKKQAYFCASIELTVIVPSFSVPLTTTLVESLASRYALALALEASSNLYSVLPEITSKPPSAHLIQQALG